jgi:hypothetical protein
MRSVADQRHILRSGVGTAGQGQAGLGMAGLVRHDVAGFGVV